MENPDTTSTISWKEGWLSVSLEGFAQQNRARHPAHLVKELVQNALDAVETSGGRVELTVAPVGKSRCKIECKDDGTGIPDMENIRTVFWTSKKDSVKNRGRMGRGFKELLCLSESCRVASGTKVAEFSKSSDGRPVFRTIPTTKNHKGTTVEMIMPWRADKTTDMLREYFEQLLPPPRVELVILGHPILRSKPRHVVEATLPTEEFRAGKWIKSPRKTIVELVECPAGHRPLVYEMGIPVCPLEWDLSLHANILQRVPMNPNRDAVMSGYIPKIHRACLPVVLGEMSPETATSSWVGEAACLARDLTLQKEVLRRAFGDNLARSVPDFGKFSHDADAHELVGAKILDTRQLTGGFREIAKNVLPTSAEVAKNTRSLRREMSALAGATADEAALRYEKLMSRHGKNRVRLVCEFHRWLAENILRAVLPERKPSCRVRVADFGGTAEATWTDEMQILTLALDLDRIWSEPFHRENFALIVHETAHELAAHHGNSFATAMEITAGAACLALFSEEQEVSRWKHLLR
jgi:hypothetical protein